MRIRSQRCQIVLDRFLFSNPIVIEASAGLVLLFESGSRAGDHLWVLIREVLRSRTLLCGAHILELTIKVGCLELGELLSKTGIVLQA